MPMTEYVLSRGEGTLIAHGTAWQIMACDGILRVTKEGDGSRDDEDCFSLSGATLLVGACDDDCPTGK